MLTDKDIQKMIVAFKTREESEQDLEKLEERLSEKHHEVLNKLDAVFGEVKEMRQEQSVHRQEHDDIDKRLDKIESVPAVAHELKKSKS